MRTHTHTHTDMHTKKKLGGEGYEKTTEALARHVEPNRSAATSGTPVFPWASDVLLGRSRERPEDQASTTALPVARGGSVRVSIGESRSGRPGGRAGPKPWAQGQVRAVIRDLEAARGVWQGPSFSTEGGRSLLTAWRRKVMGRGERMVRMG
jgi:hypothetical protein